MSYYVSFDRTNVSDYTDMGGDIEYDYEHVEVDFKSIDEAMEFYRLKDLENSVENLRLTKF